MGNLLSTVFRTVILDDGAFQEWGERPNVFLRGILLIIIVSLVAGLISFAVNLVTQVQPFDAARIEEEIRAGFEQQFQWNPAWQGPDAQEAREMMEEMVDVIVPMVSDIMKIEAPLPRGITGFFNAVAGWLTRSLTAIGGWLFYGVLVLIFVNLLGGSAKLPDFLGMVSLYVVPGLLGLLSPVPCLGGLLALIGTVWSIVVYVKATSVSSGLDGGKAVLAVFAPFFAILVLGIVVSILWVTWLAILL